MFSTALQQFAQTSSDLTEQAELPTSDPVTTNVQVETADGLIAGLGIVTLIFAILSIANLVFLILALIHLIKNPDAPNRTLWIVLSLLVPFASWVYVFGPRKSYNKNGGGSAAPAAQPPVSNPYSPPQQTPGYNNSNASGVGAAAGVTGASASISPGAFAATTPSSEPVAQAPIEQTPVTPPTFNEPTTVSSAPVAPENPTPVVEPAPSFQMPSDNQVVTPTAPQLDEQTPAQTMPPVSTPGESSSPEDETNPHTNGQA